ncbi:hypothetical protein [Nocardioides sp.]|uniref:hypothetical protein n=1 Tax=Nocardioides sp. TaxID=35761 RepID=UPI0019A4025B|nr:hypothetical protein [Nocardioides sp.]MBC7275302.1 hypothetical protein [Nocardioides sp.]
MSAAVGPKEVFWVEGASHVDLYDREPYVGTAVERLGIFFAQNLAQNLGVRVS